MKIDRWIQHFARNGMNRAEPDWGAPMDLKGKALVQLRKSIQQFQLGDGGGPGYLIAWNRELVLSADQMRSLVDLWFAEEREHSRLLGEALRRIGGERIDGHWSFSLFCGLRRYLGINFEMRALLLTEIVSHVYYKMLRRHCEDGAIGEMCRLIIRDEAGHIAFHRDRLVHEAVTGKVRHGWAWRWSFRVRGLMAGTVLWVNHRGALRALGATDGEFYRRIWRDMGVFIQTLGRDVKREETWAKFPETARRFGMAGRVVEEN